MSEQEMKPEEKSLQIKIQKDRRSNDLGGVIWALILIWAGVVFLADNLGYLGNWSLRLSELPKDFPIQVDLGAWGLVFIGAGVLLVIEVLIRAALPRYQEPVVGKLILALVFFGIGLGAWDYLWPAILIVFGISVLLGARKRE